MSTISDRKIPVGSTITHFLPDVDTYQDYFPFGMVMSDRNGSEMSAEYRYGFNGMEYENELYQPGNAYDFGARVYDGRIGRWFSVDPLSSKYPYASPYNFALNSPIWAFDPDGREVVFANKKSERQFNRLYKAADDQTRVQLDALKSSEVIYYVNTQASIEDRQAESKYNFSETRFDILIDKRSSNQIGSLGDELTHAYQFEIGEIGYVLLPNGDVRTLGYDMEDEAASKRGDIRATQAVNALEGANIPLDNTTQAFQKADTDPVPKGMTRNRMIENYFKTDSSAKQYLGDFQGAIRGRHSGGNHMGVNIPGNGGYTEQELQNFKDKGTIKDFIYREVQSDDTKKTIKGQ